MVPKPSFPAVSEVPESRKIPPIGKGGRKPSATEAQRMKNEY